MGIRIVEPQIGNPCWCHPEPVNTPYLIYVHFSELVQCPGKVQPPNGHTFVCYQDEGVPCTWKSQAEGMGWRVYVYYHCMQNQTEILLTDLDDNNYFDGVINGAAPEHFIFSNIYGGCAPGQLAYDGVATLFWMDTVQWLIAAMGIPNDGNTFLEVFLKDEVHTVYKFCNRKYSMNQTIQVS